MILSIVYLVLIIAAGSDASPCKARSVNGTSSSNRTSSSIPGAKAAFHQGGGGTKAGLNLVLPASSPTTSASTTGPSTPPSSSSGSTSNSSPSGGAGTSIVSLTPASGSCPAGFLNTVFNTNAGQSAGFPGTTWSTLTQHGMNNWIGFSLDTLDKQADYGLSATQASQISGAFNQAQIPIVMDHTYIDTAKTMLANNPPPYMELFNEPDFSFENLTLTEDAGPSATDLMPLINSSHPSTKFISPALMNANGPWLGSFFDACTGCIDQIDIIALHVYNPDPQGVMDQITKLHDTWGKTIWITELSPATSTCTMDASSMASQYINVLIPEILKLGYVEKIFWNSGEPDSPPINSAPGPCSPSLTNPDGSSTAVLQALGAACGFNPGAAATS